MSTLLLAFNAGSSSLKFEAAEAANPGAPVLSGVVDRIGAEAGALRLSGPLSGDVKDACSAPDHAAAMATSAAALARFLPQGVVAAVGHRVVHGGAVFSAPAVIDDAVVTALTALVPLAPLHQPHSLSGIAAARAQFPDAVQVACFDTAFHASKPFVQDSFGLPRTYFDQGVRRYGFHGLSCQSILRTLRDEGQPVDAMRLAIAHLGNGCSVTAVLNGVSQSCSMGFSTLDGLAMGTRCGRIDPGVLLHLLRDGMSPQDLETLLYKQSGLLGLSGESNDMRDLLGSGTPDAKAAVDFFVARVIEEIARAAAVMGGLDQVVFCGGIGENAAPLRDRVAQGLTFLRRNGGSEVAVTHRQTREEQELLLAARAAAA